MMPSIEQKIIVIGASSGGLKALKEVLSPLPQDFALPIVIVQHFANDSGHYFKQYLKKHIHLAISTVDKPLSLNTGHIYLAPSNQHVRIKKRGVIEPYAGPKINYARPSIDVLFKSVAECYSSNVIALILTGSNQDGAEGCAIIAEMGGHVLIQNPLSAEAKQMPESCLKKVPNATLFECQKVAGLLWDLTYQGKNLHSFKQQ